MLHSPYQFLMKISIFIKILDFSPKKYENTRFIANFGQFIAKNIHFLLIYWNLQQKLCGFKKKLPKKLHF